MKEKLEKIQKEGLKKIEESESIDSLQEVRKDLMGKKSGLSEILKSMGSLSAEEKKEIGMKATEIREIFTKKIEEKEAEIISNKSVLNEPIDITLPGKKVSGGALHPITQMCYDLNDAFLSLGFEPDC